MLGLVKYVFDEQLSGGHMKYRVKFQCYWYNTGRADNHYYFKTEDFDTIDEAQLFKSRVDAQLAIGSKSHQEIQAWENSDQYIVIENGTITGKAEIVKFYPEREEII